ncbi:MAG TPA: hypothetical protein VLL08_23675 [Kineosporiaceae bacterium]|nr:hypothetical protein [Kineosporiaceae bacterium]
MGPDAGLGAGAGGDAAGGATGVSSGPSAPRHGLLAASAALVAAVIYGPMLLPGYPLRYDLVSVPDPVLGADALGLGDRLPRAIPLDAAVAVLARVLPDDLVTQILGLLALTLAGWGVAVLTPASMPGRLLALLVAEWNPFVLEQLAIGHLPHLLGYGALPWVAIFGRALVVRPAPDRWPAWGGLTAAAGFGSLTPGGGALVVIAGLAGLLAGRFSAHHDREDAVGHPPTESSRSWAWPVGGGLTLVVLQFPWVVAALAAPAFADPADSADGGITAFALRSETGWGRLVDALGLAGMWNEVALPASRGTVLARMSTVLLLVLAAAGLPALRRFWRAGHRAEPLAAVLVAGIGYLVAVLPVLPGGESLLRTLIDVLPGAGILRDGHRWLALLAVPLAVLCGLGAPELARLAGGRADGPEPGVDSPGRPASARRGRSAGLEIGIALFAAALVIASMPDLPGGLAGRLRARHYPAEWAQARAVLDRSDDRARVLVLPWQPFRVFGWSGPDPVLDPAPRLLPRRSLVSDAVTVSGRQLPQEGLGARAIAADLTDGELSDAELRSLAVGWVVIERGTPGGLPVLPSGWTTVLDGPELSVLRAPGPLTVAPGAGEARMITVIGAQVAAGLLFLTGLLVLIVCRRPDRRFSRRFSRSG